MTVAQTRSMQVNMNARLRARGRAPIATDGEYGPQTKAAVHTLKYLLGFALEDLNTGPSEYFRTIVAHPERRNPTYLARAASRVAYLAKSTVAKAVTSSPRGTAVHWAGTKVGMTEHPAGSNGGPGISDWQQALGFGRVPWCGIFVGTALRQAGVQGVSSRIASVALIQEDAINHRGCYKGWVGSGSRGVLRGDLAVIGGYGVHVELVVKAYADGSADTIGGNTSFGPGGSQSNGGCVARRHRSAAEVHGFALVDYPG